MLSALQTVSNCLSSIVSFIKNLFTTQSDTDDTEDTKKRLVSAQTKQSKLTKSQHTLLTKLDTLMCTNFANYENFFHPHGGYLQSLDKYNIRQKPQTKLLFRTTFLGKLIKD